MLYCNYCGQCNHINDSYFEQKVEIEGTEIRYLNAVTGDVEDYGDSDTSATGNATTFCPNCNSTDIEWEWEGTAEESNQQRMVYQKMIDKQEKENKRRELEESIANSEWDLDTNLIHKKGG